MRTTKDSVVWGIWVVKPGERIIIGTSSLGEITREPLQQASSGSMIFRREYWGKGIASHIHKARTLYAFEQLGLDRIKSAVIQGNVGSRKALERSGYTFVYTERNGHFIDGRLQHMDNLECLNPDSATWKRWWGSDKPPKASREARQRTTDAMNWASENVTLP